MSDLMLDCRDVSIRYMVGDFKNIGLKEWIMRRLTGRYQAKEFWADRNVSFTLNRGDMLGIIGTNGAGKSTLLKVISGIMEPTRGKVVRNGQVSALLELASGFDADLNVKENAYLRGAMLGYTRKFMDETYKYIIDFSGLGEFEDRPFKQLSSGMKARLAFSIASLVQPEILILDEVLSVGDGAFKAKSEAKMRSIISGGATTILVSHSVAQIQRMCNKVLWLEKGRQIAYGDDVEGICGRYRAFLAKSPSLSLLASRAWSAGISDPLEFCSPADPYQFSLLVKGAETLVFSVKVRVDGLNAALPRAGLIRLRFTDGAGRNVAAPAHWLSTAYGGEFIYIHLDASGSADFKVRVQVPQGVAVMDVQFCPFLCKTTMWLDEFTIKCGDDVLASPPRVHDPSELTKKE